MAAKSTKAQPASLPIYQTIQTLLSATAVVAAAPAMPDHRWPQTTERTASSKVRRQKATPSTAEPSPKSPLYVRAPSPLSPKATAVQVAKGSFAALRDCSNMFPPLRTALNGLMIIWDRIDDVADVQADFVELASKLEALTKVITAYDGEQPGNTDLTERLDSVAVALDQLTEAIETKTERRVLTRAAQSTEDIKVVRITFRRVSSLLEVFQFEGQVRTEKMLATIIEQLRTTEQRTLTSDDVTADDDENVVNNNSNKNELDGPADLDNNNSNETELEIEGPGGGGIVNNNSNVNRVTGAGNPSPGGSDPSGPGAGNGAAGGTGATPWSRTRISNNNSNKNVVRRIAGAQGAKPNETSVPRRSDTHSLSNHEDPQ